MQFHELPSWIQDKVKEYEEFIVTPTSFKHVIELRNAFLEKLLKDPYYNDINNKHKEQEEYIEKLVKKLEELMKKLNDKKLTQKNIDNFEKE